ncbi:beta-N-acetylhexosaminidase, partial [Candidatus Auribacterota bacterium]
MIINKSVGEMFLVGFNGITVTRELEALITKYHIGGVILYSRNMKNVTQLSRLCHGLQEVRRQVSDTPLIIAIDQEGGVVHRGLEGITVLPGNMALGSVGDDDSAHAAGRITATELALLGVNVNFAPVLDISNNPDNPATGVRSFGGDPGLVSRLGEAMIKGLQEYGIIACAKHFPGKGNVSVDSHLDLPLNRSSRETLDKCELMPFKAAIAAKVGMIMTAHVMYPEITESKVLPATLSHNIMTKILRDEMKYDGVLITDDMEMGAIEKYFTVDECAVGAVQAGNDMIMFCHTPSKQKQAIQAVNKMAADGKISAERIQSSNMRIHELKAKLLSRSAEYDAVCDAVPVHQMVSERIGRDSITIYKNEKHVLPFFLDHDDKLLIIAPKYEVLSQVEEKTENDDSILDLARIRHENTRVFHIDLTPGERDHSIFD